MKKWQLTLKAWKGALTQGQGSDFSPQEMILTRDVQVSTRRGKEERPGKAPKCGGQGVFEELKKVLFKQVHELVLFQGPDPSS